MAERASAQGIIWAAGSVASLPASTELDFLAHTLPLNWYGSSLTPLYHNPHQQYDLHQTLVSSPSHILVAQTGLSKCFLCCFFNLLTFKNHFRLTATVGKSDEKQCFSDSRHPVFLLDSRPCVGIHRAAVAGVATSLFPFYILVIRLLIDCRYLQIIVYIRDSCPLLYCRFHRLGEMQNGRCPPWLYHRGLCVPEIISRLIFRFSGPHRQRLH